MKFKRLLKKIEQVYENYISKIERGFFIKYPFFYKNYLRLIKGFRFSPLIPRNVNWINTTLKSKDELDLAIRKIKNSRLNLHPSIPEKNWDSLIALNIILQNTDPSARILDAGGQINSLILSWLYQFGYSNLNCLNLRFKKKSKRGGIEYFPGDLTNTIFPDNYFDIITCISVIEHGVDEKLYFKEMYRILKRNGLLITSTDYWEFKIKISNKIAYNNPVFVHDKNSIKDLLKRAYDQGFELFGSNLDLKSKEKVAYWKEFDLSFTFLIFCLKKI